MDDRWPPYMRQTYFPHPLCADEYGILAMGGDLSLERLTLAYQFGIFPWSNPEDPLLWHFPRERCILWPQEVKVAKSMRRYFNQGIYHCTKNTCFTEVIKRCAVTRSRAEEGTWISDDILEGYTRMHEAGRAHAIEVWREDELVGGLYGVQTGRIFSGESMFSDARDASKFALISMCREAVETGEIALVDCQVENPYLMSMGATVVDYRKYYDLLTAYGQFPRKTVLRKA